MIFRCQNCQAEYSKWSGKCLNCGQWDSLIEVQEISSDIKTLASQLQDKNSITKLSKIITKESDRISSGFSNFDTILGGGIVPGSILLIAGEPGIGKSTLTLQITGHLANKIKVLYVSGEEALSQIKLRADRIGLSEQEFDLISCNDFSKIASLIAEKDYQFIIIDSIQTILTGGRVSGSGTMAQLSLAMQTIITLANSMNIGFILIGHITKDGEIAGPKTLEHLVDVVIDMVGEKYSALKVIRAKKNRFGGVDDLAMMEMGAGGLEMVLEPSNYFIGEYHKHDDKIGSIIFPSIEGNSPILVEIQALVTNTNFNLPKRMALGTDNSRLSLILAILSKHLNCKLDQYDVYLKIVGGLKINDPGIDLAMAVAIYSALHNIKLSANLIAFGEVGLNGIIGQISNPEKRLKESIRFGFTKAIAPSLKNKKYTILGVDHIKDLTKILKK